MEEETDEDKDTIQARFIAQKIRELIGTEVAGEKISYKDIGILYRSINRRAKIIMQVLAEEGIPVIFDGNAEQIETQEISIFLKLLNLIDNHKQDIPLLTVLNLPLFDFDLDDEVQIRSTFPDFTYFYEAVEAYRDQKEDDLAERLKAFYNKLNNWRELSRHLEIDDFLWRLLLETGYYSFIGGLSGGKERKRNLRILLERAVSYKNSSLKGLSSFLQYVSRLQKRGQTLSTAGKGAETEDAVHLMSIHKSKGLEFPILFISDTQTKFNTTEAGDIIFNKHAGYGTKHIQMVDNVLVKNDTLLQKAVHEAQRHEEYSEEMRLLYVAMTRAKNQLYVIAALPAKQLEERQHRWNEGCEPQTLLNKNSFLDWIMSALLTRPAKTLEKGDSLELNDWLVNIVSLEDSLDKNLLEDESVPEETYLKLKEQLYQKLGEPLEVVENNRALKMSVTHLKQYGIDNFEPVELVSLEEEQKERIDYTQIGTAVHRVLQMLDLDSVESGNIQAEIDRILTILKKRGEISEEIGEQFDPSLIIDFYNSELGRRLIKAYKEDSNNLLQEMPFSFDIRAHEIKELLDIEDRPIEISGIIDACFIEDNKWILIDYKTDRYYNSQIFNQRLEEYQMQIELYSRALERLTGLEVAEKHIYFLSEREDFLVEKT